MAKRIVVIGNWEHGRTTLIQAISRVYGQRTFMNGESAEAHIQLSDETYVFFDYPDPDDYFTQLEGFDGVVACIAGTYGPDRTTGKLMELCARKGAQKLVVFVSKIDEVDDEDLIDFVEMDIADQLQENGFNPDDCRMLRGSAYRATYDTESQWGNQIRELVETVAQVFGEYKAEPKIVEKEPVQEPCRVTIQFSDRITDTVTAKFSRGVDEYNRTDMLGYTVTTSVLTDKAFYGWLLSLGEDAKLLEPEGEVKKFTDYIDGIRAMY